MAWLKNLTLVLLLVGAFAHAETAPLHNLLNDVQQLRELDGKTNAQRVRTFTENHQNQQTLLEQSRLRLEAAEAKQQALKQAFDDKDVQIAQLEALLSQRS
ncbi:MAG: MotA/TolQ/ExbB proton channel family protein, partial [Pontibacterium sp.]